MSHSYDVRIWKLQTLHRTSGRKTYGVRWVVGGVRFRATFATKALAESHRSDLLAAARKGEAFDTETGEPLAWGRSTNDQNWFDFAQQFTDLKWHDSAATTRRSRAEALMAITIALLPAATGGPSRKVLRTALRSWAFNTTRRGVDQPAEVTETLRWVAQNGPPVSSLAKPDVLRSVVNALGTKLDGTPASTNFTNRRRMVLSSALNYAVECQLLDANPLGEIQIDRTRYKSRGTVDRRSVVSPPQARDLLRAVADVQRSGPRLVAFFAAMYYAALRPEEAVNLHKHDLDLPESGWGEIHVGETAPDAGAAWTDSGQTRDRRGLKHRAVEDTRHVPCQPELTRIFHDHLDNHGTDADGRLFRGERGGQIDSSTYERVWRRARSLALGDQARKFLLAKRPYDLRHAAVSTWLNAGVPATQVAEWAGHSVAVLLRVYAKCIDGTEQAARRRIDKALGLPRSSGWT